MIVKFKVADKTAVAVHEPIQMGLRVTAFLPLQKHATNVPW